MYKPRQIKAPQSGNVIGYVYECIVNKGTSSKSSERKRLKLQRTRIICINLNRNPFKIRRPKFFPSVSFFCICCVTPFG